jgi:hypothetical protein
MPALHSHNRRQFRFLYSFAPPLRIEFEMSVIPIEIVIAAGVVYGHVHFGRIRFTLEGQSHVFPVADVGTYCFASAETPAEKR